MFGSLVPLLRARKAGLLRLRAAQKPIRFECLGARCRRCCSVMGGGIILRSEGEANLLPAESVECVDRTWRIKDERGVCTLLKGGRCVCYQSRPKGCQEYPWYNISGNLYYDRGCPGMKTDGDNRPDIAGIAPIETYLPLRKWILGLCVLLMRQW